MEINTSYNKTSFQGYDARSLKGLFITVTNYAKAISMIAKKNNIDIFTPNIASKSLEKEKTNLEKSRYINWAQDYFTFIKNKIDLLLWEQENNVIYRFLSNTANNIEKDFGFNSGLKISPHLRGGNFFITDNKGKKEMLLSENKKSIYPEDLIKEIYNIENIHYLPQLDYHLDLFLRPLNNGNILVADNNSTKNMFKNGIRKITQYIESNNLSEDEIKELNTIIKNIDFELKKFEITTSVNINYNFEQNLQEIINRLKNGGYNPIPTPGNCFYFSPMANEKKFQQDVNELNYKIEELKKYLLKQGIDPKDIESICEQQKIKEKSSPSFGTEIVQFYESNFLNAIAIEKEGQIIYITNAPLLDKKFGITTEIEEKTGFSTKKYFIDSVKKNVDNIDFYFIDDNTTSELFKLFGGIHCCASEIV